MHRPGAGANPPPQKASALLLGCIRCPRADSDRAADARGHHITAIQPKGGKQVSGASCGPTPADAMQKIRETLTTSSAKWRKRTSSRRAVRKPREFALRALGRDATQRMPWWRRGPLLLRGPEVQARLQKACASVKERIYCGGCVLRPSYISKSALTTALYCGFRRDNKGCREDAVSG